jgi:4-amino-4-deoxy-L-arabinose transferase
LILILLALVPALFISRLKNIHWKVMLVAMQVIPVFFAINTALPTRVFLNKSSDQFFSQFRSAITKDDIVLSDGTIAPDVNWSLKRQDLYIFGSEGEMEYGLTYPDANYRSLDITGFHAKLDEARLSGKNVAIFCRKQCPAEYEQHFPANAKTYTDISFSVQLIENRQPN